MLFRTNRNSSLSLFRPVKHFIILSRIDSWYSKESYEKKISPTTNPRKITCSSHGVLMCELAATKSLYTFKSALSIHKRCKWKMHVCVAVRLRPRKPNNFRTTFRRTLSRAGSWLHNKSETWPEERSILEGRWPGNPWRLVTLHNCSNKHMAKLRSDEADGLGVDFTKLEKKTPSHENL